MELSYLFRHSIGRVPITGYWDILDNVGAPCLCTYPQASRHVGRTIGSAVTIQANSISARDTLGSVDDS